MFLARAAGNTATPLAVVVVSTLALSCSASAPRDAEVVRDAGMLDATIAACQGEREPATLRQPPAVEGSGAHGSIAALSAAQKREFCAWLWALPDYGTHYCCPGVNKPLRVAVQHESDRGSCVDDLAIFEKCPEIQVEAYETCAVAKLSRYCGTPLDCDAFSNQGQTSACLAR